MKMILPKCFRQNILPALAVQKAIEMIEINLMMKDIYIMEIIAGIEVISSGVTITFADSYAISEKSHGREETRLHIVCDVPDELIDFTFE